ncbi:hypothetical protein [Labedella endophytica]|uniref:Uncharacterized protein n=1 Tax=Labedella endophytica TaxID=1523160 RepID=A0A433JP25_9MICO|nr:hypothetical protein [Labedella endophytica]RUQ97577.1 hypothetical protein ELQ94_15550 [Labedella endophytica]
MLLRRAFFYWQFIAAIVLPLWLFVGWGVSDASGWSFVGLLVLAPLLFVFLTIVSVLVYMRAGVRRSNAVSWLDMALVGAVHVAIVVFGLFTEATSAVAVLGVVLGLAAFWGAVWQLVQETRERARAALREFEQMATSPTSAPRAHSVDGRVIVVEETHDGTVR